MISPDAIENTGEDIAWRQRNMMSYALGYISMEVLQGMQIELSSCDVKV